jgi:hypothetical protein
MPGTRPPTDRPDLLPESANGAVQLVEVTAFGHVIEHHEHARAPL